MRALIITIFMFSVITSYAQEKVNGFVELIQSIDQNFTYSESNLNFGINYNLTDACVSVFGAYVYGGVSAKTASYKQFKLDYHLFGGGLKLKFRDAEKLYNPLIKLSILTEIDSKYRGGKLMKSFADNNTEINFLPTKSYYTKTYSAGLPPTPMVDYHYSYHYISTPLLGSLFFENEFKIRKGISLHIGIGYLLRMVRYAYNEWTPDMTEPEIRITKTHSLKETTDRKIETVGHLEFEFGISYNFSFGNKNNKK